MTVPTSADDVAWNEPLTRAAVKLGRSFGVCEYDGHNEATDMHHRRNASQGGTWCPANILHLCRACHRDVTTNPTWAEKRGLTLKTGQDPERTPITRHGGSQFFVTDQMIAIAGEERPMTIALSPADDAIIYGGRPFGSFAGPLVTPGVYTRRHPHFMSPGSDAWSRLITPSKVAAIMGYSRFESAYRLWHRMKELVDPEAEKDIFKAGHAFELALAELWKGEQPGWQLSPGEVQYVGDASKYGFPFAATLDRRARSGSLRRIVEFKTARSLEDWGDEFTDEAPLDYVLQVTALMLFSGLTAEAAHLVVMGPYFKHHTYRVEYSPNVAAAIVETCLEFYLSLAGDEPPPLDSSVATYECVRAMHPDIARGTAVTIPADLAEEFHTAVAAEKAAKERERFAKTRVSDLMGDAQYAEVGGVRVARRQPAKGDNVALYVVKPKPSTDEGEAA